MTGKGVKEFACAVRKGERRALARAITIAESSLARDRIRAESLLSRLLPYTGRSTRLAITGAPGVGKSTFIEILGLALVGLGHRVAVLTIDPSSARTGGSILGDKTRMMELARVPASFIRPAPAGRTLGGVARRTRESILLCEAAGYDVVIVETVGIGQSEVEAADMTDLFLLLIGPGAGDGLQGIKRGVMELAEIIVVTKADGDFAAACARVRAEHLGALRLLRARDPSWSPPCLLCSSVTGEGFDLVLEAINDHRRLLGDAPAIFGQAPGGALAARRAEQARNWMWREVETELLGELRRHPKVAARARAIERSVVTGKSTPQQGARRLLGAFAEVETPDRSADSSE